MKAVCVCVFIGEWNCHCKALWALIEVKIKKRRKKKCLLKVICSPWVGVALLAQVEEFKYLRVLDMSKGESER